MILNLDGLLVQMRHMLWDEDGLIWGPQQLEECVRLGLARLQSVCPIKLSLEGLDDAAITILEDGMSVLLLRMTLLHAWHLREQGRSETFHPDPATGKDNQDWLRGEGQALEQEVEHLRQFYLQRSLQVPYGCWPDRPPSVLDCNQECE